MKIIYVYLKKYKQTYFSKSREGIIIILYTTGLFVLEVQNNVDKFIKRQCENHGETY